jgi:hypothetical protein
VSRRIGSAPPTRALHDAPALVLSTCECGVRRLCFLISSTCMRHSGLCTRQVPVADDRTVCACCVAVADTRSVPLPWGVTSDHVVRLSRRPSVVLVDKWDRKRVTISWECCRASVLVRVWKPFECEDGLAILCPYYLCPKAEISASRWAWLVER